MSARKASRDLMVRLLMEEALPLVAVGKEMLPTMSGKAHDRLFNAIMKLEAAVRAAGEGRTDGDE